MKKEQLSNETRLEQSPMVRESVFKKLLKKD